MVVKHNDRVCLLQKLRTFGGARSVRIHDHDERVASYHLARLLAVNKHILRITRFHGKHLHQWADSAAWIIYDDLCLFAKHMCRTVNTDACAEGIHIRDLVSHDKDILTALDDLTECMCLDTRLDTGVALDELRLAAVIGDLLAVLDNDLIAASSKCKVDRRSRILIALVVGRTVDTDSDT